MWPEVKRSPWVSVAECVSDPNLEITRKLNKPPHTKLNDNEFYQATCFCFSQFQLNNFTNLFSRSHHICTKYLSEKRRDNIVPSVKHGHDWTAISNKRNWTHYYCEKQIHLVLFFNSMFSLTVVKWLQSHRQTTSTPCIWWAGFFHIKLSCSFIYIYSDNIIEYKLLCFSLFPCSRFIIALV